jgi:predicted nucleotidyltransferase
MTATDIKLPIKLTELQTLLTEYGVVSASIFGSYARGEATENSDLDLLVTYKDGTSLFDVLKLNDQLESVTGKRVDLVSKKFIKPRLAKRIQKDLVKLY